MTGRPSVIVIGDVMTDIIVKLNTSIAADADTPAHIETHIGGAAANLARWLVFQGAAVRLIGRVGVADHARLTTELTEIGVEARLGPDHTCHTGTLVCLVDQTGERSFLTDRGANDALSTDDAPIDVLDECQHLHVSGYALTAPGPRQAVGALIQEASARGLTVSVDPGSVTLIKDLGADTFLDATRRATLICPNAAEAAALTGHAAREDQLRVLSECYPLVIIKDGKNGAQLFEKESEQMPHAAAPSEPAVDTTGAGDAFLACFLAAWLGDTPLANCLEQATRAGRDAIRHLGGGPPNR